MVKPSVSTLYHYQPWGLRLISRSLVDTLPKLHMIISISYACWYDFGVQQKGTSWHLLPLKTQISLHICAVWSESSMGALWIAKGLMFLQIDLNLCCSHIQTCTSCWILAHDMGLIATKSVFGVSDKARLKLVSSATETS